MQELNETIIAIIQAHPKDPRLAIQELLNLLSECPPEQQKAIQTAILFTIESIHEWCNLMKYI